MPATHDAAEPVTDEQSVAELEARRDELAQTIGRLAAEYDAVVLRLRALTLERADADAEAPGPAAADQRTGLTGADIRRAAIRVWLSSRRADAPMHYRELYDLVTAAGYSVAGRDPVAAFLTQITRSPLARHTGIPGEYVLDLDFERRARQELRRLYESLVDAHRPWSLYGAVPEDRSDERRRLTARVEQLEREVREVSGLWDGIDSPEAA